MSGRITSKDKSKNEFGVPYALQLQLHREAVARQSVAYQAALKAWLAVHKASSDRVVKPSTVQRLRRQALELTEKALS